MVQSGSTLPYFTFLFLLFARLGCNESKKGLTNRVFLQLGPFYGVACWLLWSWRNRDIFDDQFLKPTDPFNRINVSWNLYVHTNDFMQVFATNQFHSQRWIPPDVGWVKVNVDGAVARLSNRAGCEGVIRDNCGSWIMGFTKTLGQSNPHTAEEWAVYRGLMAAADCGFRQVIIESDAKVLVDMLNSRILLIQGCYLRKSKTSCLENGTSSFNMFPGNRTVWLMRCLRRLSPPLLFTTSARTTCGVCASVTAWDILPLLCNFLSSL